MRPKRHPSYRCQCYKQITHYHFFHKKRRVLRVQQFSIIKSHLTNKKKNKQINKIIEKHKKLNAQEISVKNINKDPSLIIGRVLRSLKLPANEALSKMMQLGIGSSPGIVKVTNSLAPNPDGSQVFWNPP